MNVEKRQNLFVIGDIHGQYDMFLKMLSNYNKQDDTLVLIGDLIDRGTNSKEVLAKVLQLSQDLDVSMVYIRGNHESLFMDFLEYPTQVFHDYIKSGGDATLISLLGEDFYSQHREGTDLANAAKERYPEIIRIIKESVLYYQRNNVLCVHAGLDPMLADYRMTSESDFMWIRDEFLTSKRIWSYTDEEDGIEKPLKIIHGHTPNPQAPVMAYNRINVDGGAAYGGSLVGVLIDQLGDLKEAYKINSHFHLTRPAF